MSELSGKLERQETHAGRARCSWRLHLANNRLALGLVVLREDDKGPLCVRCQPGMEAYWWRRAHVDGGDIILERCTEEEATHAGEEKEADAGTGGGVGAPAAAGGWTKSTGPRARPGRAATRRG